MSLTFTQFLYISAIEKGNECITAYSDLADDRISHEQVPEPAMIVNNEGNYTADTGIDGISVRVSFTEEANSPEETVVSMREIITDTVQYAEYF